MGGRVRQEKGRDRRRRGRRNWWVWEINEKCYLSKKDLQYPHKTMQMSQPSFILEHLGHAGSHLHRRIVKMPTSQIHCYDFTGLEKSIQPRAWLALDTQWPSVTMLAAVLCLLLQQITEPWAPVEIRVRCIQFPLLHPAIEYVFLRTRGKSYLLGENSVHVLCSG